MADNTPTKSPDQSLGVVGGVLLDLVLGASSKPEAIDRPVSITAAVGGVGYNVARNLRRLGANPVFLSALREDSIVTAAIIDHIGRSIDFQAEVATFPSLGEAVYIDMSMLAGRPLLASSSSMDDLSDEQSEILVRRASAFDELVVDVNAPPGFLDRVHEKAIRNRTALSVISVSDAKAARLLVGIRHNTVRKLVGLNKSELENLGLAHLLERRDDSLLHLLSCENLLVTLGSEGSMLLNGQGFFFMEAPQCDVIDYTGAGDAMFSALLFCLRHDLEPRSEEGAKLIADFVIECLQRMGA